MASSRKSVRFAALGAGVAAALFAGIGRAAAQAPPQELAQPSIVGSLRAGATVEAREGTWSGSPTSFRYRWQRCRTRSDTTCIDIAGATARQYRVTSAEVGRRLRVWVAACNGDGCGTPANSRITGVVSAVAAPANTRLPAVPGTPQVGLASTADVGSWDNGVSRFAFQWQRCDANGANCGSVPGAVARTYVPTTAEVGSRLRVIVTAFNNRGSGTAVSAPGSAVRQAPPAGPSGAIKLPSGETSIPVSGVSLPARLVISGIRFTPTAIRSRSEPLVGRFRVTDTRGFVVRDALVYAIGVPSNRISLDGERATDVNGWATFSFQPLRGLPLVRGATLVLFLRARKAGENLLAGVSTRRLVSIRISPR